MTSILHQTCACTAPEMIAREAAADIFPGDAAEAASLIGTDKAARAGASGQPWRILGVLSALMGFASISTDLYLPAMPAMGAALAADTGRIELTVSGFLIGFSLGQLEVDVLDIETLKSAMDGQDVVYANLSGDMAHQARIIIDAMHATGIKQLIFIGSMGIYGEVPGERYRSILDPYRDSAALIEHSDLDYTILRPGWFTHDPEVRYQITRKANRSRGPTCR